MVKIKFNEIKNIKSKFWFRLFLKIAAIFVVFVAVLCLCNSAFLEVYYKYEKKKELISLAQNVKSIRLSDAASMIDIINSAQGEHGIEVEVYDGEGNIEYSTMGGKMMDYFSKDNRRLQMNHRPLKIIESSAFKDGSVMQTAIDEMNENKYLLYKFSINNGYTCELRVQHSMIKNSADIANRFITIIAVVVFLIALFWVFWFSKSISKPIVQMNDITGRMADLDFSKKLPAYSDDEIGQLAKSINHLSQELDNTLMDLKKSNAKLRNEIELEHQLDVMRKGFVANVSHELKTPISIIQGYAEGLKLEINSNSKDKYCDVIMDESKRMNKLVLSLLNLSKYESNQANLNNEIFDICSLAKSMAARIFENSDNVEIIYIMPENAFVKADSEMIEQALKSYFENAKSHVNENGSITVEILKTANEKIMVSVYNTGSHIDEEIMPQIWQSFYRGDKSHNRNSGRFGLGLSIVSAIIKLHNENCGVYNTADGICFWFTLAYRSI